MEEARGDIIRKSQRILIKDAEEEYLRYKKQKFAERTHQTDKQQLGWILDFSGNIPLSQMSTNTIVDYVEARQRID